MPDFLPQIVRCLTGRHRPDHEAMENTRRGFVAPCRGCGVLLSRHGRQDWRPVARE